MGESLADKLRHVLVVEDSPDDIVLIKRVFRDQHMLDRLSVMEDGEAALAFLRRQGPYAQAPRPDLILLDLSLPKKDGRAVLEELKTDPALSTIPVLITTSSKAQEDFVKSINLKVTGYIPKPVSAEELAAIIKRLKTPGSAA